MAAPTPVPDLYPSPDQVAAIATSLAQMLEVGTDLGWPDSVPTPTRKPLRYGLLLGAITTLELGLNPERLPWGHERRNMVSTRGWHWKVSLALHELRPLVN